MGCLGCVSGTLGPSGCTVLCGCLHFHCIAGSGMFLMYDERHCELLSWGMANSDLCFKILPLVTVEDKLKCVLWSFQIRKKPIMISYLILSLYDDLETIFTKWNEWFEDRTTIFWDLLTKQKVCRWMYEKQKFLNLFYAQFIFKNSSDDRGKTNHTSFSQQVGIF